ncbi:MAG: tetratricopeptide repeat protein [Sandaracinus sp.]|nr:tetratricopeptide repeat protein [Sandaracinus sp.]
MRVLAVFLLLVASPVFAQPSASDERARELYLVGDDLYSQGRYEEALAAFEEAYRLSERPLLLFNIANAQERSGQWQGAIESLEGYLPHADEAERARIESRIESLRRRVARLEAMQQVPEGNEREPEPTPTPEEPGPSLAGPLVLAAGGALLAGGITSAILAKGARDSLESECVVVDGRRLCGDTNANARCGKARSKASRTSAPLKRAPIEVTHRIVVRRRPSSARKATSDGMPTPEAQAVHRGPRSSWLAVARCSREASWPESGKSARLARIRVCRRGRTAPLWRHERRRPRPRPSRERQPIARRGAADRLHAAQWKASGSGSSLRQLTAGKGPGAPGFEGEDPGLSVGCTYAL